MAGPHRRYSYLQQETRRYLVTETPQRFEVCVSNVLDLGAPILFGYSDGECPPRCTSYYGATLHKYPHQRQNVVCRRLVGFTPVINGGVLSSQKDSLPHEGF